MPKFVVSATVDDPKLANDAKFSWKIIDNDNYVIDKYGGVEARKGYTPKVGDTFTVEVSYICKGGFKSTERKTFTVKI